MRRLRILSAVLVLLVISLVGPAQFSHAETVAKVVISEGTEEAHSTLTLTFDEPISETEAAEVKAKFKSSAQRQAAATNHIVCSDSQSYYDSNGTFSMQLTCLSSHAVLAWGWR